MNLGDLPNPRAAAEAVKDFRKRFSAKSCMAPSRDCQGAIIAAHTLSAKGMLLPLSRNGHVYAIDTDPLSGGEHNESRLALKGIKATSVFNGFCQKHDRDLFAPIETKPFACTPEQCFLHAFRAVAKECYLKRKQAENLTSLGTIKAIHGIPKDKELRSSDFAIVHQEASLLGAVEVERFKARIDQIYLKAEFRRICTTVVPFSFRPGLVCNFLYAPDFDFSGNYVQNFEDPAVDLSHLMVTVLPGLTGGFALLSHLDTANRAPSTLIKDLLAQPDITSALVWLIACQTENFALSPDWYDALDTDQRTLFMKGFNSNTNSSGVTFNQLKGFKLSIPSWNPGAPFTI